jgi:hypothetical protein
VMMILKTKDGYWIEGDDSHEFIVPHKHRSNFVLDDWCGISNEELQNIISEALEKSGSKEIIINGTRLTEVVK